MRLEKMPIFSEVVCRTGLGLENGGTSSCDTAFRANGGREIVPFSDCSSDRMAGPDCDFARALYPSDAKALLEGS